MFGVIGASRFFFSASSWRIAIDHQLDGLERWAPFLRV
jgi:hypothetical protein